MSAGKHVQAVNRLLDEIKPDCELDRAGAIAQIAIVHALMAIHYDLIEEMTVAETLGRVIREYGQNLQVEPARRYGLCQCGGGHGEDEHDAWT